MNFDMRLVDPVKHHGLVTPVKCVMRRAEVVQCEMLILLKSICSFTPQLALLYQFYNHKTFLQILKYKLK